MSDINAEVWREHAESGLALPEDFIRRHIYNDARINVIFSKPIVHELLAIETCDVKVGSQIEFHMTRELPWNYNARLRGVLPVILRYADLFGSKGISSFRVSLGDEGSAEPTLAFSSRHDASILVPDPDFVLTMAYEPQKRGFLAQPKPWPERAAKAFWRGTDTGVRHYQDISKAPRVAISLLSEQFPDQVDAGITATEPRSNETECRAFYTEHNLLRSFVPPETMLQYRYQVDIDGNSNAWSSLFLKLLSGSPVLKVASELNYRQWYYHHLRPWINFVPVANDLSDIMEKIAFLEAHPEVAHTIARNAKLMAQGLTYESQIDVAATAVMKHVNGF